MPANPKYLTQNKWQRFAKVSAAILGGFMVSVSLHLAIGVWLSNKKELWGTYLFSLFIVWCTLMLVAFLFKSGWKCWVWYGGISSFFLIIILTGL